MTLKFIKSLLLAAVLSGLSACSSSSGSASAGTQVNISASPSPINTATQAAGAKTFTFSSAPGDSITLTRAYLVISSATIESSCGASFSASLEGILDFLISPVSAHTTTTPTSTGEPYVINLLADDNQSVSIGNLSPPTDDYCGLRLDLLAADADAVNLPIGSGEPDMVGKTIHIEGTYSLSGGGSGNIHMSTGASLINRDVMLSALLMISGSNLNGQVDIGINYDTWFNGVDLATLETETASQTNPTDTNVGLVLQNITASIHQL